MTQLPKWKRGEKCRLVKTEEQMAAAARCLPRAAALSAGAAGRRKRWMPWTPEIFYAQLQQEKQEGWACYLHCTKDVPDGMVSVHHKTGQVEHLFVTESARGRGMGQKMLDFARKKLPEHEHPVLTVLNTNTRAMALYRRMGWKVVGAKEKFDPAKDRSCAPAVRCWKCAMRAENQGRTGRETVEGQKHKTARMRPVEKMLKTFVLPGQPCGNNFVIFV